ncbi:MAG: serine acetyltransferase [Thermoguttaceae bacterium]|nr:serine acetyltransferase [Thermoguttaceae bacterium]
MEEIRLTSAEKGSRDALPELTENIVASYSRTRATCRLDRCSLPNKEIVAEILSDLNEVLFPGFRRRDRLTSSNVVYYVGNLVDKIYDALRAQISRAFCGETANGTALEPCRPEKRADFDRLGDEKAAAFLARIPEIREKLEKDVEAAMKGDPACKSTAEVVFCYPGFEAITTHRIARALWELGVPLLPRIMSELAHSRTGVDIHPGAKIGEYFFIDHGTGVVIGETCEIGDWVKIYQGVTLGALSFPRDENGELVRGTKRHPTLEDGVVAYANATILGGDVVVGRDSVIGSNVWLTKSVDPRSTIVIEKPRLVVREN